MRNKIQIYVLIFLLLSTNIVFGKDGNKTKTEKTNHKKHAKDKLSDRLKRSFYEDDEHPFWANRGKREIYDNSWKEEPFWGARGRRDTAENLEMEYPVVVSNNLKNVGNNCKNCFHKQINSKDRRDELLSLLWGNRDRHNSDELEDNTQISSASMWSNKDRRQENEPFWGTRGKRQEDSPFWGNRGRRDDVPFWGNRGRRQDSPFWGTRGRRDELEPFWGNRGKRENSEPFWGNRGRRQDTEPFWGARGRREYPPFWSNRGRNEESERFWGTPSRKDESEPFWGARGRREEVEPFWGNRGKRKEDLKEAILNAISDTENKIENLSKSRQSNVLDHRSSFWNNRGRKSTLKDLFNDSQRSKYSYLRNTKLNFGMIAPSESSTVLDDRIFAEQPHYILVERSSRSSAEDDPYFISRGKKKNINFDLAKVARGRRGAIEEIVKSVRNDPYYIARGKKDLDDNKIGNSTTSHNEFVKAKELICSTIDLIMIKNDGNKAKREMDDNDRDRRTILKNLAAQLQMDPYFVSRGKKNDHWAGNEDDLEDFINQIAVMCN